MGIGETWGGGGGREGEREIFLLLARGISTKADYCIIWSLLQYFSVLIICIAMTLRLRLCGLSD